MNIIIRILLGGLVGWLVGKAAETEGAAHITRERHRLDVASGIVGAFLGEYLFFWIVMGQGDWFSRYATAVLGSIAVVGVARVIAERIRRAAL
jgi:uncharacterized membrane protein YeaQ/YmgE (transglycosylase-associated protein family)